MPIFQKNLNRVCPILENPMQLTKHLSYPFLSVPLTTLPLTGKQYHSRNGSKRIKSYQRKNKFRSKHRKRVPFSVNLPARIACRTDLLVGKYPQPS